MREIVSITGAQRWGKSTLLRERLRSRPRVLVVDAKRDVQWERQHGYTRVETYQELSDALARSWLKTYRIIFTPKSPAEGLDVAAHLMFRYAMQSPRVMPCVLAVDEMAFCYSTAHAMRKDLTGFQTIVLQAGYLEIDVWGCTQRPQEVATQFRDNCERAFFFALHDDTGREAIVKKVGRRHRDAVMSLKRFEYLEFFDGEVKKGRTKKTA